MNFNRNPLNVIFVVLLASTLFVSVPTVRAVELPGSAEETSPLKAGDSAPTFTVRTVENQPFLFDPSGLEKPVVLISFRGGWCPYCNMHLSELHKVIPLIRDLGFDVLFISNDAPDVLYSGLQDQTQEDIAAIDYTILSDAKLEAAVALGTAFRSSQGLIEYVEHKDKDYSGSSIATLGAQTVPSVFIVDTDGRIVFDYVNADYKIRLQADELLAAAREAHGSQTID